VQFSNIFTGVFDFFFVFGCGGGYGGTKATYIFAKGLGMEKWSMILSAMICSRLHPWGQSEFLSCGQHCDAWFCDTAWSSWSVKVHRHIPVV
jgi:hypothetical protein